MVCSICQGNGHNKKTCPQKDSESKKDTNLIKKDTKSIKKEIKKPIKKETSKKEEFKMKDIKVKEKDKLNKNKTLIKEMKELSIEIYDSDCDSTKSKDSCKINIKQVCSNMYIYQDDKSNKFWKIEYIPNEDGEYRIEYGRMGKPGKIESKSDTYIKIKKLIECKTKKGYILDSKKSIDCFSLNL